MAHRNGVAAPVMEKNVFTGNDSLPATNPKDAVYAILPMDRIQTWEENPRKCFDAAGLAELAANIAEVGQQQPIVVRRLASDIGAPYYSIVIGERRFRACQLLGLKTIACLVRTDLNDATALRLAMAENVRRRDLSAIEEAQGYSRLMDLGMTQAAIAKDLGVDASTVSNLRRLLKLPSDVQAMVADGRLSVGAARAILRFDASEPLMQRVAEMAIANECTVRQLETGMPFAGDLQTRKLIQGLSYGALFDVQAICVQNCPFGAYLVTKDQYSKSSYCLRPDHYIEMQNASRAENLARAEEEARKRLAVVTGTPVKANVIDRLERAAMPSETPDDISCEKADAPSALLDLTKFTHYEYCDLKYSGTIPVACTSQCLCRRIGIDGRGNTCEVCIDPGRLNGLKAAETKVANKERRSRFTELLQDAQIMLRPEYPLLYEDCRRAAMLVDYEVRIASVEVLKVALADEKYADLRRIYIDGKHDWKIKDTQKWQALAALGLTELLALVSEIAVRTELRRGHEAGSNRTPRALWVLGRKEEASAAPSAELDPDMEEYCLRCNEEIAQDVLGGQMIEHDGPARIRRYDSGLMVVEDPDGDHGMYCPACAPSIAFCRTCGCTDEMGCVSEDEDSPDRACHWIEPGLCSRCWDKEPLRAPVVTVTADGPLSPATTAAIGELVTATVTAVQRDEMPVAGLCGSCGVTPALEGGKCCADCDPQGRPSTCQMCGGSGVYRTEALESTEVSIQLDCVSCGGTGYVRPELAVAQ